MVHEIHRASTSVSLVFVLAIAFCNLSAAGQQAPATAFIHVNVVPMDREVILRCHDYCSFAHSALACFRKDGYPLTTVAQKPSIVIEQATSSYSFRSSELSQPI